MGRGAAMMIWAIAVLGACGDDDDDDDTEPVADAGVDAAADAAADAAPPDAGVDAGPESPIVWHHCDLPYRCGTLPVPLDHADPDGPTIDLAFVRTIANWPQERIGLLMFNPGGPGGRGIDGVRSLVSAVQQEAPDVLDRFDLVGFDPRGIGESTTVDCLDDDELAEVRTLDMTPDDEDEWTIAEGWGRRFVDGCEQRSAELVRHVDSESVARDMDLLRAALGEEQISYFGVSYGTYLGTTYATLFPDRVRAFVLDSPVGPAADWVAFTHERVVAYELELERFFEYCGPRGLCDFHGGDGADVMAAAYDALAATADTDPLPAGEGVLTENQLRVAVQILLRAGEWVRLDEGLAEAEAGDASSLVAIAALSAGESVEAHVPVMLLDQGCPADYSFEVARETLEAERLAGPRIGIIAAIQSSLCGLWPLDRPAPATPLDGSAAPPMLVMAGENDPATPYSGVPAFLDRLGNGSHLLTWQGNGHGVALRNGCTLDAALEFLFDPSRAPHDDVCPP